ncbi:MAG: methylated-DNA--[protein]-cysteine S-methyltransferase [Actinobacteria bacterium]|nr:methylated-DNA--[protein]-cysteine S-methyltransferase [Actinomycetota bacterium]NBQ60061.1 methylated-DNA--[protein]-cysteine S-methyltransferase [Actinomycetota bacterium]NCA25827.1 methylated-DNA--[protein]-cysteine S-methyltransferase [Actinomycetota bacterium]NCU78226.1 methylated-DNA--[protein]-cysteine S-methyltransferase [Actinomycetota bacterium]NCU96421.1 methylated-DNA--[protein]-cysteine S-methyltransferase [Actinomycetota bacterium]
MLVSTNLRTPIGELTLIADEDILVASGFYGVENLKNRILDQDRNQKIKYSKSIPIISELVEAYFEGDLNSINAIKVRQSGAKFSQEVWKALRKIPSGKTLTYTELAARAGSKAAIRAAGTACGQNLIAPIVPCHRIIKSGGAIGNYAYGIKIKEWLLSHEGAL